MLKVQDAKLSLESRMIANLSEEDVNDPMSMNFIRFMSAKGESDAARVYAHDHHGLVTEVNLQNKLLLHGLI